MREASHAVKVLFVSGIGGDTRRYRCLHHQEQLTLSGITSTLREPDDPALYVDAPTHDALILHRVAWQPAIADLVAVMRARGKPVIFETDDLVFAPELQDRIAYLDTLSPEAARRFRNDMTQVARTFSECDCVLTTTNYLAEAAEEHGKPAFVQRNAVSDEMVRCAERAHARPRERGEQVTLAYFSGTGSHNRDFATIAPVLAELMTRYPQVVLHLSGHLDAGPSLQPFSSRIRRAPFVAWQELPELIAQADINLAPLELDNPFCQAKSEIKYVEAALVGVPTVASATDAFVHAIRPGETGFLAATADEWRDHLTALVEDGALRARIGAAARRAVYAAYLPEVAAGSLAATLGAIVARFGHAPAPGDEVATLVAGQFVRRWQEQAAATAQADRQADELRRALAQRESQRGANGAPGVAETRAAQVELLREIVERLQGSRS